MQQNPINNVPEEQPKNEGQEEIKLDLEDLAKGIHCAGPGWFRPTVVDNLSAYFDFKVPLFDIAKGLDLTANPPVVHLIREGKEEVIEVPAEFYNDAAIWQARFNRVQHILEGFREIEIATKVPNLADIEMVAFIANLLRYGWSWGDQDVFKVVDKITEVVAELETAMEKEPREGGSLKDRLARTDWDKALGEL